MANIGKFMGDDVGDLDKFLGQSKSALASFMGLDFGPDADTVLLIHSDNVDESTSFVDSGGGPNSPHTISRTGDTNHETDEKKFCASSIQFDGTGDNLIMTDGTADWDFGTGDFTIEWQEFRTASFAAGKDQISVGWLDDPGWLLHASSNGCIFYNNGGQLGNSGNFTQELDVWQHMCWERYGNFMRFFRNGSSLVANDITGVTIDGNATDLIIGADGWAPTCLFDEIRISKVARYQGSNFTAPTAPFNYSCA